MGRRGVKYVIGLTGNIATGKSLVATRLAAHGARHIDADRVAHETIEPDEPAWEQVRERFGRAVLRADGTVDRRALGRIVFDDPVALRDLEAIVHPQVLARIDGAVAAQKEGVIVVEAIKLIESGLTERCQALWITTSSPENQLARLSGDRGLDVEEARRRMDAQPDAAEKVARADVLLVNDGSRGELTALVDREWREIAAGTAPVPGVGPEVEPATTGAWRSREGGHVAEAVPVSPGQWRLTCHSPTRLPRLMRPLLAALEGQDRAPYLHVPVGTGYRQFMRGMGYREVCDCVTESGYVVYRH